MTERMRSYAQNAEDVVLARAFPDKIDGFFVDIGANDPRHDSVTYHFSQLGWTGVNVEPQRHLHAALEHERPKDINLNCGVGSEASTLTFWHVPDAEAMSTFSTDHADQVRSMGYKTVEQFVEVLTLNDIFDQHVGDRTVDFLKVDVEGFEEQVLGCFDWSRYRPRVVLVESQPSVAQWEQRMVEHGYSRTMWDGINLFFVRNEDADELGNLLNRPAVLVLDRYDPVFYLEQLTAEAVESHMDRLYAARAAQFADGLREAMGPSAKGEKARKAVDALAATLARRPDVTQRFGVPPNTDVAGLLTWAAAQSNGSEVHTALLAPHLKVLRTLGQDTEANVSPDRPVLGRVKRALLRRA